MATDNWRAALNPSAPDPSRTLKESYTNCRRIARARARNFYYSFALLPRERRDALSAIYAFMRRADDIVDSEGRPLEDRQRQLADWRRQFSDSLDGGSCADSILPAFRDTVRRHKIPRRYFAQLIDGMQSDLLVSRYKAFEDLYNYCYKAAGVVGLATVHVLGFESERALALAEKCGVAFQLTNILRDIREDAQLGRVYVPETELERFGLSRAELLDGSVRSDEHRFRRLMEYQWDRADGYYKEAEPLLSMVDPQSQPALWAMVTIYRSILERIRAADYRVLERRIGLPTWKKLWIAAKALRLRSAGGTLPFPR